MPSSGSVCAVCGRRLTGGYYRNSYGDAWCPSHQALPACAKCGVPARGFHGTEPRCKGCLKATVDHGAELLPILMDVGSAMAARGLVIARHVRLVLRERDELVRTGLFADPHYLGVTRSSVDQWGRGVGEITIAIVSDLTDEEFRAVLVHEFAHAYLSGMPTRPRLPDQVEEGFAEALAHVYLVEDYATERAVRYARRMVANADPVYGEGLRRMLPHLHALGAAGLASEMASGRVPGVGQAQATGRKPRRTRPV